MTNSVDLAPTKLSFNYQMIEDYNLVKTPLISDKLASRFAVIERSDNNRFFSEIATISHDEQSLLYFRWEQSSDSGWVCETCPLNLVSPKEEKTVTKMWAFYGTLFGFEYLGEHRTYIFCQTAQGSVYGYVYAPGVTGSWTGAAFTKEPQGIFSWDFYQDADGQQYIMYATEDNHANLSFLSSCAIEDDHTAKYRIMSGNFRDGFSIFKITAAGIFYVPAYNFIVSLKKYSDTWNANTWQELRLTEGGLNINYIEPIVSQTGSRDFIRLDNTGELYYVSRWDSQYPNAMLLTGGADQPAAAAQFTLGLDGSGNYWIFVLDKDDRALWVLRQTGRDAADQMIFGDWVPLGGTYSTIASPRRMTELGEVFAVTFDFQIIHKRQDVESKVWRDTAIKIPILTTEDSQPVTSYATEITVYDQNGAGMPNQLIDIYASENIEISVNGFTHHIDAATPVTQPTDLSGKLTVSTVAEKLTTASLIAHVHELMTDDEAIAFNPGRDAHNRLAGKDANFSVTGDSLQKKNLISNQFSADDAQNVASVITAVAGMMITQKPADNAERLRQWLLPTQALDGFQYVENISSSQANIFDATQLSTPHWELDFSDPSSIKCQLLTREEAQGRLPAASVAAHTSSIGHYFGDVAHYVKHEAKKLKKLAVSVENDITSLEITLEDDFKKDVKRFVINTVKHAGEVLEIIFHKIADAAKDVDDAMKKVIEWVRLLFEWEDIKRTGQVIYHYLDQTLANLVDSIDAGTNILDKEFDGFRAEVKEIFADLQGVFESGVSFNSYVGGSTAALVRADDSPLLWQDMRDAHARHSVRCNYVSARINSGLSRTGQAALSFPLPHASDDSLQKLIDIVMQNFPEAAVESELKQSIKKILDWSSTISDVKSFFDAEILTVLELTKDLVDFSLLGLKAVLDVLLEMAKDMISNMRHELSKPFPYIPIISDLLKAGDANSWLHLISFALAVPTTILYKLVYGHGHTAPFTSGEVTTILNQPIPWPQLDGSAAQPLMRTNVDSAGVDPLSATLGIVGGISWWLYASVDLMMDATCTNPVQVELPNPIVTRASQAHIVLACAYQGFGVPIGAINRRISNESTTGDAFAVALWGASFVPIILDGAFVALSSNKALARYVDTVGPIVNGVCGAGLVGLSVTTAVKMKGDSNYNNFARAEGILGSLPVLAKFLILAIKKSWGDFPVTLALGATLGLLDEGGNRGAAVCRVGGSV